MSLNIAARALVTNQSVLGVIGHNIANANTVGYSRQTVSLDSVAGQKLGNGYFGKGVEISGVKRSYDAFLTKQANATQTVASAAEVRFQKMQQVEALFPLGAGSLGSMLNTALNAWVDVQSTPTDSTARQVVIDKADEFAARVRDTFTRLDEIGQTARLQSTEVAKSINQYAKQIADLNDKVVRASSTGVPPNDLLDQRDQALAELNKLVKVATIGADDGSVTVFVASSQALVIGKQAASLEVAKDPADPDYRQVVNFVLGGTKSELDPDFIGGGELMGLQQFINEDLNQAMAEVGRMALATAVGVNNQHKSGLDRSGNPGVDFFGFDLQSVPNSASPSLSVTVSDHKALVATDYEITATGAGASIKRTKDGSVVNVAGPPFDFDGLTVTVPGSFSPGDRYVLRPASDAAKTLRVAISHASDVAASSSVQLISGAGNSAGLTIEAVTQVQSPAGTLPIAVTFNAAGEISLDGGAFQPFFPGQAMVVNGYSLTLRGTPDASDTFSLDAITPAAAAFNAGNAQAILALRDTTTFDGTVTLADGYVAVFSSIASTLNESKVNAEFSAAQATQAETQRANVAGVNLDEEAALLIQYQQAYQASAKYMSTVQSLFDTLLSAFR